MVDVSGPNFILGVAIHKMNKLTNFIIIPCVLVVLQPFAFFRNLLGKVPDLGLLPLPLFTLTPLSREIQNQMTQDFAEICLEYNN